MTKIKVDCFAIDNFCQVNSPEKSIDINNPLEKEFVLEIFNHGADKCIVKMKTNNISVSDDFKMVNLMISSTQQILFKGNFLDFAKNEILLGMITPKSSANYVFYMDLFNLVFEEKKLDFGFDLVFDFNCESYIEEKSQMKNTSDLSERTTESVVLSSNDSASESTKLSNFFYKLPEFFLLLSILFVAIFFVIMKFINDQKKKKQAKTID